MVIMTLVSVHILQSCHYFCNFIAFNSKTENLILLSTHFPYAYLIWWLWNAGSLDATEIGNELLRHTKSLNVLTTSNYLKLAIHW